MLSNSKLSQTPSSVPITTAYQVAADVDAPIVFASA